jgi:hypothetical protein
MIKIIRLVTGEDVVADIQKKDNVVLLKQPHRLVMTQEGLGSIPLCPFAKSTEYEISSSNILFEAEPEPQIRDSYASQVGAIVVPTKAIVTP